MIDKEQVEKLRSDWIAALRDEDNNQRQAFHELRVIYPVSEKNVLGPSKECLCVIGWALKVADFNFNNRQNCDPYRIFEQKFQIRKNVDGVLINMNDDKKMKLSEIADAIEKDAGYFFKQLRY